jgi:hypothetical protein
MNSPTKFIFLMVIALSLILSSCSNGSTSPKATEVQQSPLPPTQSSLEIDSHSETAFTAYPIAEKEALIWNAKALLYQIPPTRQMEQNFGLPPGGPPGWFFMFKEGESPVEFYVEIVDGKLYGKTEAQPILVGEPKYKLIKLPMDGSLLDSDHALQVYLDDGGKEYTSTHPDIDFDFQLIHLEGIKHPIWSIFDSADPLTPLYNVNAVTGEKAQNPYSP